ncbi:hypothetical protein F0562_024824 [Nyssa sinensis]|uniref:Uncharacterized protein n=1 Tax=Nyssa sinensis TaxID=561372 RepID=A0A5J5BIB6_9ASTE|nr:hypothetical protein F0562_024824 [Nyssa sinensis]
MAKLLVVLVAAVLLVCLAEVSYDFNIEDAVVPYVNQIVHKVVVRGVNRRLMENKGSEEEAVAAAVVVPPAPAPSLDCGGLCNHRCSQHSRPNLCKRACGTCCVRCKCVPPGTSGNRELCGSCYTDMTTHRNKTKCP